MDLAWLRVGGWVVVALGMMLGACGGGEEETAAAATAANGAPTISGTSPTNVPPTSAPPTSDPPMSEPPMSRLLSPHSQPSPRSAAAPADERAVERAPTITGAPGTAVMHGTEFSFMPAGDDPDGDTLMYSIVNAPAWASFDAATGRLSGTPAAEHVGAMNGIVISVSDGERSASLAAFTLTVQAVATGSATLSWLPPTTNTDGSPLTNLVGYKIYWGNSPESYPNTVTLNNPGLTRYVVTNLVPGTWFFVATALSGEGAESAFSSPASGTIQ